MSAYHVQCLDEHTALSYVDGTSTDTEHVVEHLEDCPTCRELVVELAKCQPEESPTQVPTVPRLEIGKTLCEGDRLGRYEIEGRLGQGGMGQVYLATDTVLERQVALKLLHQADVEGDGFEALQREARKVAKLQHENVVTVFDVSAEEGVACIAMQYVSGGTLKAFSQQKRSWRETRQLFLQVGRALQAAHALGIVHRDVKPDNILVTVDGNALLTDFGLAYVPRAAESSQGESLTSTQTNAGIVGTPAYMAPEQFLDPGDASQKSDQYGFCVSLYQALYGERPFTGTTVAELTKQKQSLTKLSAPSGSAVPRWLHVILERGLSPVIEDRFESMSALLAKLEHEPWQRTIRFATVAIVIAALGTIVFVLTQVGEPSKRWCETSGDEILAGWNAPAQDSAAAAFSAASPIGDLLWKQTKQHLDQYSSEWRAASKRACSATHVQHVQSTDMLDRRTACLRRGLLEFEQLVVLLKEVDQTGVEQAPLAALSLSHTSQCEDHKYLTAAFEPPPTAMAAVVSTIRVQIAGSKVALKSGSIEQASKLATEALQLSDTVRYPAVQAEARIAIAEVESQQGKSRDAANHLEQALLRAEAAGDDFRKAIALTLLVSTLSSDLLETKVAEKMIERAEATVERVGTDALLARLLIAKGRHYRTTGAFEQAGRALSEGIDHARVAWGDDAPWVATGLQYRAALHAYQGDYSIALVDQQEALRIRRSIYGPTHPNGQRPIHC